MSDNNVETIGGNDDSWMGERMDPEEIEEAVEILEEWIRDIRYQRCRGFAIAGVGPSGVGGTYRTNRFMGAGANRTGIVGAVHLLAHHLESEICSHDE